MSTRFQEESGSVSPQDNSSDEGLLMINTSCLLSRHLLRFRVGALFLPTDTEDASEGESDSRPDSLIASGKGRYEHQSTTVQAFLFLILGNSKGKSWCMVL